MKKTLSFVVILFCATISLNSFASFFNTDKKIETKTTLNIYEKPDATAKITAALPSDTPLIQIFRTDNKDWIKVANPQNGDVGWIKTAEFSGPIVTTQISGNKIQQQIVNNKDKQPQSYSLIQYSSSNKLKPEDAEKAMAEMEKRHEKMRTSMQKMQEDMQKIFKEFDKY